MDPAAAALASLLTVLGPFCPPAGNGLPAGSVTLVDVTDRPVLLDGPPTAQARMLQLAGLARFQLWFAAATGTDSGVNQLTASLLGQRQALRAQGLLRLRHSGVGEPAEFAAGLWGRYVDVDVLYEYAYTDPDDALGLIATVQVDADAEPFTVTDRMTRWDALSAPALVVRGLVTLPRVSLVVHASAPPGPVEFLRTVDDGPPPVVIGTLPAFLAAVGGDPPARLSARCTVPDLATLQAAMSPAGDPVPLGDPAVPYQRLTLSIDPPLRLATGRDRFEISHPAGALGAQDVAYLSAH
jgi:hypothetical protein